MPKKMKAKKQLMPGSKTQGPGSSQYAKQMNTPVGPGQNRPFSSPSPVARTRGSKRGK